MKLIDGYVRSPFAGLAPWILMAVVAGPGRFEEAASAALGLALLTLWVGRRRGFRCTHSRRSASPSSRCWPSSG